MRCTQATLEALGINGQSPKFGTGIIEAIGERFTYEFIYTNGMTLRRFIKSNQTGSFYLTTASHAMALVNGKLTDTSERGVDGRRINFAVKITGKK